MALILDELDDLLELELDSELELELLDELDDELDELELELLLELLELLELDDDELKLEDELELDELTDELLDDELAGSCNNPATCDQALLGRAPTQDIVVWLAVAIFSDAPVNNKFET